MLQVSHTTLILQVSHTTLILQVSYTALLLVIYAVSSRKTENTDDTAASTLLIQHFVYQQNSRISSAAIYKVTATAVFGKPERVNLKPSLN